MRYELVRQQPYCCRPACLQMILRRRKISHGSQEDIGNELGLVVPKESAHHFKNVRVGQAGPGGYGTRIDNPEFSLDKYFERHGIGLHTLTLFPRNLEAARIMVSDFLRCDADIMALVDAGAFYGNNVSAGHFVLVENLGTGVGSDLVSIVDPNSPARYCVLLRDLFNSINVQRSDWQGGLCIVAEPEILSL